MSWAETMYQVQQFYSAFELNDKVKNLENSFPVAAYADSTGEKPENVDVDNQNVGSIWFIKEK
jgi:hypothetical protein